MFQTAQKTSSLKKTLEQIQKSQYYQTQLFYDYFPNQSQSLQSVKHHKLIFYSAKNQSTIEHSFNKEAIRYCCQKIYLTNFEGFRLNRDMFKRTIKINKPFSLLFGKSEEVLHFHIEQTGKKSNRNNKIVLYVVHHCNNEQSSNIKWLNFVETYSFQANTFRYVLTAVLKSDETYMETNRKLFEECLQMAEILKNAKKMEGSLLQYQDQNKLELEKFKDPAFNTDHRVLNRIKPEFLAAYYHLQKQFPTEKQDLICRYLIALQYDLQSTRTAIKAYRQWHTKISQKFCYQDFSQFHKLGIFMYLGEDRKGRPVFLNKAKNVKPNQIDIQKYCYYYIYYLEIFAPTKMRGYVSQLLIIADVEDLGMENFKLQVTRKNIEDSLKYCPERQYKMIAVNVSQFAMYWWRIMSPLLPKKTLQKVMLAGSDRSSVFHSLEDEMDKQIIPDYLGGQNPIVFP